MAPSPARSPLATALLAARRREALSFAELGERFEQDEGPAASLMHGQTAASPGQAEAPLAALQLQAAFVDAALLEQLTTDLVKDALDPVFPTDPMLHNLRYAKF